LWTKDSEQILSVISESSYERFFCKRVCSIDFYILFLQSRARCQDLPGALLSSPCVKLKDKMLQRRDANIWATAQVPQRGTSSVGISSTLWKGKKSSDIFQAVPSSVGYVEPLEDCE
jgi:hypothetical protein